MGTPGIETIQTNPGTDPKRGVDTENAVETITNHVMIIDHRITTDVREVAAEVVMTTGLEEDRKIRNHTETNDHDTIARIGIQTMLDRVNVEMTITTKVLETGIAQRTGVMMIEEDNETTVGGEHHSGMHVAQSRNLRQ